MNKCIGCKLSKHHMLAIKKKKTKELPLMSNKQALIFLFLISSSWTN